MPRTAGALGKKTLRGMQEIAKARRVLRRVHGDDLEQGGVAMTTALLLVELTRNVYEEGTRLGAAKELSGLEYAKPKPVEVNAVTGEVLDGGAGGGSMQVELWDTEEVA